MLKVEIVSGAEADLQHIFNRLEDYREGSGVNFIVTINANLERLSEFPESGPFYVEKIRRLVLRRPPYGIFYEVQRTRLIVLAILDLRQDSRAIAKRLNY